MESLNRMVVFAEVVARGSMSGAARALGMSPSAVSQQVRALEREGGITLLHRSTRRLATTDAGARLYEHCAALVEAARRASRQLAQSRDAPEGELRLAAPVGFARHVAIALGPLLADHPTLTMHLAVDDAMTDLIEQRIDLAIRFGRLADSTWVAQPLAHFAWVMVASPACLRRTGMPATVGELAALPWVGRSGDGSAERTLTLHDGRGAVQAVTVRPRIASNNVMSLTQMAIEGLGAALLPRADVDADLHAGRLVEVLPGWAPEPIAAYAVTPQRDAQPAKVRLAIEALRGYLRTAPGVRTPD